MKQEKPSPELRQARRNVKSAEVELVKALEALSIAEAKERSPEAARLAEARATLPGAAEDVRIAEARYHDPSVCAVGNGLSFYLEQRCSLPIGHEGAHSWDFSRRMAGAAAEEREHGEVARRCGCLVGTRRDANAFVVFVRAARLQDCYDLVDQVPRDLKLDKRQVRSVREREMTDAEVAEVEDLYPESALGRQMLEFVFKIQRVGHLRTNVEAVRFHEVLARRWRQLPDGLEPTTCALASETEGREARGDPSGKISPPFDGEMHPSGNPDDQRASWPSEAL